MKVITILGVAFLAIILFFVLPRKIREYDLTKTQDTVTVKVVKLPDCTTSYKNKFIHVSYDGRTYILRTKCKYVKSLVVGQQIIMFHEPNTEIFLFPTENAKSELLTTILLGAFMTLCIGVLIWKQHVTNRNAHNMSIANSGARHLSNQQR